MTQSSTLKANSIAKEGKESVEMRKKLSVRVWRNNVHTKYVDT